ncbi:glycoside hydrolase family 19 protein [Nodosilinea nodulosa]|uniref:glycoside hydrolase family 19 protein n=1 Tax=Nodosilinea nodulosa TaxID=416001 RepID=UPI0002E6B26A|nr:glycoside hydrolase family 19 protein [Nodosilinea nodulosa]
MTIDRKTFYDTFRTQFHPTLTQQQVDGYSAILDYWEASEISDLRWLAYVLATAYHETGQLIAPVREGFCKTDEGSIQAVTKLYTKGIIKHNYAKPEANGNSYFGRGLVQLTWADNYKKMGQTLGMGSQLYDNPALLLDLGISVKVLFKGMIDGLFTGQSLEDYFNATKTDWMQARKIVNGMDKASAIADYAQRFKACLA